MISVDTSSRYSNFPSSGWTQWVKNSSIRTGHTPHKALRGWGRMQGEETTISGFNNIKRRNAVGDARSNRRVKPSVWLTNESPKLNHNCEIIQYQN